MVRVNKSSALQELAGRQGLMIRWALWENLIEFLVHGSPANHQR
jgi:hypothetical protein